VNVLPAGIGIVVLTNAAPIGVPEALCRSFLDLVLIGKVERDWFALFGRPWLRHGAGLRRGRLCEAAASPKPAAAAYVGSYAASCSGRCRRGCAGWRARVWR
jgi:hypothetical protein